MNVSILEFGPQVSSLAILSDNIVQIVFISHTMALDYRILGNYVVEIE